MNKQGWKQEAKKWRKVFAPSSTLTSIHNDIAEVYAAFDLLDDKNAQLVATNSELALDWFEHESQLTENSREITVLKQIIEDLTTDNSNLKYVYEQMWVTVDRLNEDLALANETDNESFAAFQALELRYKNVCDELAYWIERAQIAETQLVSPLWPPTVSDTDHDGQQFQSFYTVL